jgi:hypothetical protein
MQMNNNNFNDMIINKQYNKYRGNSYHPKIYNKSLNL